MKRDVIIVGGGVIGVCAALYARRAGYQVTLIEKKGICAGASHGNACWIAVSHATPTAAPGVISQGLKWMLDSGSPFYIKPRPNLDLIRWLLAFRRAATERNVDENTPPMLEMNRQSHTLFQDLAAEGLDFDYVQQGLLHVHLSEKYREQGVAELDLLKRFGVDGHFLTRPELEELQPNLMPAVESGIFYPEPAQVRPDKFVNAVADQADREGVDIILGEAVLDFETRQGEVQAVITDQNRYTADHIVLAAGAWTTPLAKKLGLSLRMEPANGYSITVKRPSRDVGPQRAMAVDDYKLAVSPLGDAFRFSSTLELGGFDPSINEKRIASNWEGLRKTFGDFGPLEIQETWSGYRPLSADGVPIIGRPEGYSNLILATGHGMLGLTQGPITGRFVVDLLDQQPSTMDLTPFRPDRF